MCVLNEKYVKNIFAFVRSCCSYACMCVCVFVIDSVCLFVDNAYVVVSHVALVTVGVCVYLCVRLFFHSLNIFVLSPCLSFLLSLVEIYIFFVYSIRSFTIDFNLLVMQF